MLRHVGRLIALSFVALGADGSPDVAKAIRVVPQCDPSRPVQIFSDVDDTMKSSGGGVTPAGCDKSYAKGAIYPGYEQFLLELARGPSEATRVLKPTLMSARPSGLSSILGLHADSPEAQAMSARSMPAHADPKWDALNAGMPLQEASGLQSFEYQARGVAQLLGNGTGGPFGLNIGGCYYGNILDWDHYKMGETKYQHLVDYNAHAPDANRTCAVFVGDDGQGDCDPGAYSMRSLQKPGGGELALRAAFIHRLECSGKLPCATKKAEAAAAPIFLFGTYLEAADIARAQGLISQGGFRRVAESVASFFAERCTRDGLTKAPETVSNAGCGELVLAFRQLGLDALERGKGATLRTRAGERFRTFCATCCSGPRPNPSRGSFVVSDTIFRCSDMYEPVEWYHPRSAASYYDCATHCPADSLHILV